MRTRFPLIEVDSLGDEGLESPEMVVFKRLIENLYNIMTDIWHITIETRRNKNSAPLNTDTKTIGKIIIVKANRTVYAVRA